MQEGSTISSGSSVQQGGVWRDLTLSLDEVVVMAGRWMLYMAVLILVPYLLYWGVPGLPGMGSWLWRLGVLWLHVAMFVLVYLANAVVHELLHAAAMLVVARVSWRSIRFGVRWRQGVAYVHTDQPMTVQAYRVVLLLPGVVQGALPALIGLWIGSGWLTLFGYVMLVSSMGDFVMVQRLHRYGAHLLVRDHPVEIGCQIQVAP